jgi:hypothetical protein
MIRRLDLSGQSFDRLTAIYPSGSSHWICRCQCGKEHRAQTRHLRSGHIRSCGCLKKDLASERNSADITGRRSGRLVAVERVGSNKRYNALWLCACDCGRSTVVPATKIMTGSTKSCGCLLRESITTHGKSRTPEYRTWVKIWQRCTNKNSSAYPDYGGRGISVCPRWEVFENFLEDMGRRPAGMSIERIDVNGNYEPKNCRWATRKEQLNNTRRNKTVVLNGTTMGLTEAIAELRRMAKRKV